jgi:hypothetical protein
MRKYEDVKGLMYSIANRIQLDKEHPCELVHDAWISGKLHNCKNYQLSRTITNCMLRARRNRFGTKDSAKRKAEDSHVELYSAAKDGDVAFLLTDKTIEAMENKEMFDKLLNLLDFREHIAVVWSISKGQSFVEIAANWNVTKSLVSSVYAGAIKKMRESKLIRDIM